VRLYDRLFTVERPDADESGRDFKSFLNPGSLTVLPGCKLEAGLANAAAGRPFQFERLGYFCVDSADQVSPAQPDRLVFNRVIGLRDSWVKEQQKH
jgi:glutaminyl-tRNA synthetase